MNPHAPAPFQHGLPTTPREFLTQLPTDTLTCWVRGNSGLVGFGRAVRLRAAGPDRFAELSAAWKRLQARAHIDNEVALPGSGLVGFTTIAFADDSPTESVIDVPQFVMGRRDGRVWLTAVSVAGAAGEQLTLSSTELERPADPQLSEGAVTSADYQRIVAAATQVLAASEPGGTSPARGQAAGAHAGAAGTRAAGSPAAGEDAGAAGTSAAKNSQTGGEVPVSKVVLARDVVVETAADLDLRAVLGALNQAYPSTWTFSVAGMVGATPELLLGVQDGRVESRVLAGTYRVQADPAAEMDSAREQLGGVKDTVEHRYAIDSLESSLATVSSDLHVDAKPHLLVLKNVIHLASDAHGTLDAGQSILDVAKLVHPTAAVGGMPRDEAAALISQLEGADRGRYAGPVGWIDGEGNGQLGIALRCGQLEDRNRIRLWAGAGIVAGSDPASELAETWAKFAPMLSALGVER